MTRALACLALAACGGSAPPAQPAAPTPIDDGVTRCGPPAPPPARPPPPVKPAREPVPSFTAPRSDASAMPDVEGDLSPEVVSRVIRIHAEEVRACYLHLVARDPRIGATRVELAFTILGDGSIAGVEVSGELPALDVCVCERALAMRFAPFEGRASVRYPLLFTNGG
ncbi:MAG TPA: AgmX/PglI C-terminal domain-containing protein [Kofleriaceae bacterium]|nr:AgmX/PglI C-terminal domain-containing protein [Kofleriaceae bacterium]